MAVATAIQIRFTTANILLALTLTLPPILVRTPAGRVGVRSRGTTVLAQGVMSRASPAAIWARPACEIPVECEVRAHTKEEALWKFEPVRGGDASHMIRTTAGRKTDTSTSENQKPTRAYNPYTKPQKVAFAKLFTGKRNVEDKFQYRDFLAERISELADLEIKTVADVRRIVDACRASGEIPRYNVTKRRTKRKSSGKCCQ